MTQRNCGPGSFASVSYVGVPQGTPSVGAGLRRLHFQWTVTAAAGAFKKTLIHTADRHYSALFISQMTPYQTDGNSEYGGNVYYYLLRAGLAGTINAEWHLLNPSMVNMAAAAVHVPILNGDRIYGLIQSNGASTTFVCRGFLALYKASAGLVIDPSTTAYNDMAKVTNPKDALDNGSATINEDIIV